MKTWAQAILETDLRAVEKLVALIVQHHTSNCGDFPNVSYKKIAEEGGVNLFEVTSAIKSLTSQGFIDDRDDVWRFSLPTVEKAFDLTPESVVVPKVDYEEEFKEIWQHKWGRGNNNNPRLPAFKSYCRVRRKGATMDEILLSVKKRIGVDREGTEFAPMMSTWLNQERWKDKSGNPILTPEEIKEHEAKASEAKKQTSDMFAELNRQRRISLGLTA